MTDYKQLCAELHAALEKHDLSLADDRLLDRSAAALRAALAESKPEEPTDKELAELYRKSYYECENRQGDAAQVFALRAVLARWGK